MASHQAPFTFTPAFLQVGMYFQLTTYYLQVGMYFHAYPNASVNALHMHVLDEKYPSDSYHVHAGKNLPAAVVLQVRCVHYGTTMEHIAH